MKMDYLLHHLFLDSKGKHPDKIAVVDDSSSLTYHQLSDYAGCLAEQLRDAGIERGDRVAFYLDHNVEQAAAILAISSLGAVFVPVNALLYPEQVEYILCDSGARVLFTTAARAERTQAACESCDQLEQVLLTDRPEGASPLARDSSSIDCDLAAILYTSGSSGRPKGVMLSHRNLVAGCHIISDYLHLTGDDRLLGVLPLSFDYGLNQLITMLSLGGTYYFCTFAFPNDIVRALEKHKITGFAGIPTIWAILSRSSLAHTPLPHLRYITNSGGAVPLPVLELMRSALPDAQIYLMYGLTEAFRSTYLPPEELDNHPTSMGKAIPDTEILVVSPDGRLCGPGEVGELVHRGPTVSMGYWNRPDETAKRFQPDKWIESGGLGSELNASRVVYSGDMVKRDEDGFLYFVGRGDAMIKCSGNRISPTEVEEVIFKTGLVKHAAAIGIPDDIAGQVIKVFVVPLPDKPAELHGTSLSDRIMQFCAEHMPSYMVPRYVETVDEMPLTPVGKTDYPALREREECHELCS